MSTTVRLASLALVMTAAACAGRVEGTVTPPERCTNVECPDTGPPGPKPQPEQPHDSGADTGCEGEPAIDCANPDLPVGCLAAPVTCSGGVWQCGAVVCPGGGFDGGSDAGSDAGCVVPVVNAACLGTDVPCSTPPIPSSGCSSPCQGGQVCAEEQGWGCMEGVWGFSGLLGCVNLDLDAG